MTTTIPAGVTVALDGTIGAAFLGHFATSMYVCYTTLNIAHFDHFLSSLYGIASLQGYLYYHSQNKDPRVLRYSVSIRAPYEP